MKEVSIGRGDRIDAMAMCIIHHVKEFRIDVGFTLEIKNEPHQLPVHVIDELSEKVKRAAQLIKICKSKLSTTEEDVNKILRELDMTDRIDE